MISRPATSNSATPPPDVMRSATADLADKFLPDPVDIVTERKVSILEPIFRQASHSASALQLKGTKNAAYQFKYVLQGFWWPQEV